MPRGPSPRRALLRELARALGGAALLPFRTNDYLYRHDDLVQELVTDLRSRPAETEEPAASRPHLPDRPLRIFLSCAEASGEIHATGLARELVRQAQAAGAPAPELRGLGGDRLRAAGVQTIADPVGRAAMGFEGMFSSLPYYSRLIEDTARSFRDWRPDLFLPLDSPALHVPLAHVAKRYGLPVVHFITPQYWGWAPWRTAGYRKAVDRALTILPFERDWFTRRGIEVRHVGHPLLDRLRDVPRRSPEAPSGDTLCILPGSRARVIERNLPWMLSIAADLQRRFPGAPVRVVQETEEHRTRIETILASARSDAQLSCGDLHGDLRDARCALSVSGTVLIDVLHHGLPCVVIYRLKGHMERWMSRNLLTAPYFASINLLAGEEVVPEFAFMGQGPRAEIQHKLELAYGDAAWRTRCQTGLARATRRLGPPGAVARAAGHALEILDRGPGIAPQRTILGLP